MNRRTLFITLICMWLAVICLISRAIFAYGQPVSIGSTFDKRVEKILTGGEVSTKQYAIWELTQYRDTTLLTKSPFCWCPFKGYLAVQANVFIGSRDNQNVLTIAADLKAKLADDAEYNKRFASDYIVTGTKRQKLRQIYRYCKATTYTSHVKSARDVFSKRQGDCSGISAAMYVLCKANGIPVRYVIGWTAEGCHAWNQVQLNGVWYWVDATYGLWINEGQFTGRKVMEVW